MKTIRTMSISLIAMLLFTSALLAQLPAELQALRADMLAVLTGDTQRFERGMNTLEAMLAKNPKDPGIQRTPSSRCCGEPVSSRVPATPSARATWETP
jgi:hypothetical protein